MADTKVSGLAAAAAFSPSTTQEFPVNDAGTSRKVSAAQIAAYFPGGTPSGGYAQVVGAQGGITTAVDLTSLTVTVIVGAGRRVRITAQVNFFSTVTDDTAVVAIMEGATQLQAQAGICRPVSTGTASIYASVVLTPSAGAHTYKLQASRIGSGTMTLNASATAPCYILVEDIGT